MPDEKRDGYRQKSSYGHLHEQRLRIGPQTKGLPHISAPELYRFSIAGSNFRNDLFPHRPFPAVWPRCLGNVKVKYQNRVKQINS
jgi:hypothetical protein